VTQGARPAPPRRSPWPWLVGAALLAFTVFAAAEVGFSLGRITENLDNARDFLRRFWPPDFEWAIGEGSWWWLPSWEFGSNASPNALIETIQIAVLAALIGCSVALPIAFWASRLTAPNLGVYVADKGFLNVVRTVPDIFWAMLFVAALGVGSLAGLLALIIFSFSIMGKLLSETVDAADPGPLEAAKTTGARHGQAVQAAVLPQVLPNYVAYALYIFEICIRASAVIGLVGAGGIGRVLDAQRKFLRFDRVLAVVLVLFVIVFLIEQVSVYVRRRLV
jgi:phosphonate transport system permease protein